MNCLIISELITDNLIAAANKLTKNIDYLVLKQDVAENLTATILNLDLASYSHILFPANSFGKNLAPRIAAKLNFNQVSDVCEIIDDKTFVRPIYGGSALATVESADKIKILTIRLSAFQQTTNKLNNLSRINYLTIDYQNSKVSPVIINQQTSQSSRPKLENAKIIVSGGRGLKNKANFELLYKLADKLNAAIGATRAAVDAGFISNDHQVGQTGKTVAPELYFAIGISGAVQHLAGIKDSKIIIAINNDPDAPIFQYADYGLVGDLFSVIEEIEYNLCDVPQ